MTDIFLILSSTYQFFLLAPVLNVSYLRSLCLAQTQKGFLLHLLLKDFVHLTLIFRYGPPQVNFVYGAGKGSRIFTDLAYR